MKVINWMKFVEKNKIPSEITKFVRLKTLFSGTVGDCYRRLLLTGFAYPDSGFRRLPRLRRNHFPKKFLENLCKKPFLVDFGGYFQLDWLVGDIC